MIMSCNDFEVSVPLFPSEIDFLKCLLSKNEDPLSSDILAVLNSLENEADSNNSSL